MTNDKILQGLSETAPKNEPHQLDEIAVAKAMSAINHNERVLDKFIKSKEVQEENK